jgi:putative transposase
MLLFGPMARPIRIEYDGAVYHVTSRGNARKRIYKDETDRLKFLDILAEINRKYNWLCHAYCLMDNHYHLIIETPDGNLSKGMRQLNGIYTQSFNRRHRRVGHIFQGRYKAILVEKGSHLLEVCRYVVLNPVRAKTVQEPGNWKWSSYNETAGKIKPHFCLTVEWLLGQFGAKTMEAEREYRGFVRAGIGGEKIWKKVKGQSILGEEDYVEQLMEYIKGQRDIQEIPKQQRYLNRPGLDDIFRDQVKKDKVRRNRVMYNAIVRYGYSQKEIADYLGLHYSTISRLIKANEKLSR